MKAKAKIMAVLLCAAAFAPVCLAGCGGQQNAEESKAPESSVQESSQAESSAPESSKPEESSKPQESSVDEKQVKTDQAKKDIAVLLEYKKNIPAVKDYNWDANNADGNTGNSYGKLYFVDAVIKDINEDGKLEMIVKYDLRAVNFKSNNEQSRDIYNYSPAYTYDIVSVVDGKAVATEHYVNEEGLYHQGEAR